MNQESRNCQNCKQSFVIEPDDFSFYEKMGVSPPILCPECRFKRRALFRNETTLYPRTCNRCKKSIISMYHPTAPYVVYCASCWESDTWDPLSLGMEYDPARPFFAQLGELFLKVPKKATYVNTTSKLGPNINSDYSNVAGGNKDCYLIFNGGGNENVSYARGITFSRDTFDAYYGVKIERCYEMINGNDSAGVRFGHNVVGCMDAWFVRDVSGCQNCFGCVNLRHKSSHFLNEQLTKAEYEKVTAEIKGSYAQNEKFKKRFYEFSLKFPRRANTNMKTVHSDGDYIFESKNVHASFEAHTCEDCKYLFSVKYAKDSYDCTGFGFDSELLLENVGVGYSHRVIGSYWVDNSTDIAYSFAVRGSKNCFGADAVKNSQYVILNKRYSKEQYEGVRSAIIEALKREQAYGLFMPPVLAPFGYNETIGQDNLPLTREEAHAQGLPWQDNPVITKGKETMKPGQIPDHIRDAGDALLNEVLACVTCGRNYRLIPAELAFYRTMLIPIPRKCFFCRHQERIERRGPFLLFDRTCDYCKKPIRTTYAPGRPEIVYCEACYQTEVI